MLINLSEVFDLEGREKTWIVPFETEVFKCSADGYPVLSSDPIEITVRNLGNRKLALGGKTSVTLEIPCARCLQPVSYPFDLVFDEELDMRADGEKGEENPDGQSYLSGYTLDADRLVCNELTLSMPMKVLCKEDCKGICNRCGANLNFETCGCDKVSLDPRMAKIRDIFNQFKEV